MPFTKVSVDRGRKKTGSQAEKKIVASDRSPTIFLPISFMLRPVGSTIPKNEKRPAPNNYTSLRKMASCVSKDNLDSSPVLPWLGTKRPAKKMLIKIGVRSPRPYYELWN